MSSGFESPILHQTKKPAASTAAGFFIGFSRFVAFPLSVDFISDFSEKLYFFQEKSRNITSLDNFFQTKKHPENGVRMSATRAAFSSARVIERRYHEARAAGRKPKTRRRALVVVEGSTSPFWCRGSRGR